MVRKVWKVFAEEIFPLVRSLSTPQCLLEAAKQGEAGIKAELERIQAMALNRPPYFVPVTGLCFTPYGQALGRPPLPPAF